MEATSGATVQDGSFGIVLPVSTADDDANVADPDAEGSADNPGNLNGSVDVNEPGALAKMLARASAS